jgi:actin-related protein
VSAAAVQPLPEAICVATDVQLSSALILDVGHLETRAIPVFEGKIQAGAVVSTLLGGIDLTDFLGRLSVSRGLSDGLRRDNLRMRDIKEQLCYVAQDFDAETLKLAQSPVSFLPLRFTEIDVNSSFLFFID